MRQQQIITISSSVFFLMLLSFIASAQDGIELKRWQIYAGVGINGRGPANEVADLMRDHGFDKTSQSFFGTSHHPHFADMGFTAELGISRSIHERWSLGLVLQYADLREVFGYSYEGGFLFIDLNQYNIAPVVKYNAGKYFDFRLGPALMINRAWTTSSGAAPGEDYQRMTAGMIGGIDLKIWDRRVSVGKIGLTYILAYDAKVGPFTAKYIYESYTIPESRINFSALHAVFSYGFKW